MAEIDMLDGTPESIAQRLGVKVESIARAAYRHNRPDIGRRFGRLYG